MTLLLGVFRELVNIRNLKREMRQIPPDLHRTAFVEFANLDQLLAIRSLEENQLRTAFRSLPSHLFQPQHIAIKGDGFFEIADSISRVQNPGDDGHGKSPRI